MIGNGIVGSMGVVAITGFGLLHRRRLRDLPGRDPLRRLRTALAVSDPGPPDAVVGAFFAFFVVMWVLCLAMYGVGIAALISIARSPGEAFGPWWDNTKQSWILGVVVGFLLPFGTVVTGIAWFTSGKGPRRRGYPTYGRPFWNATPKPMPMPWPQGYDYRPPPGGYVPPPPTGPPPPRG